MEKWYELPNDDFLVYLKEFWYIKYPKFIGKYIKRGERNTFTDIRNEGFGKIEFPENPFNKEIELSFSPVEGLTLNPNAYYEFTLYVKNIEK